MDLVKKYWSIIVCVVTIISSYAVVQQKVKDLDARMQLIENRDVELRTSLARIETDLKWVVQKLGER